MVHHERLGGGPLVGVVQFIPSCDPEHEQRRFEQIIGNSAALESVLGQVQRVAPTSSTVLVLGETGTGKELIARSIHNLSTRCGRPFIKLNCAAIPFELLESELFGHEKGAFTGAIAQKRGRFELAHTGTLFLDEIGDIPLASQAKLLRVLQEQEFERLGSGRTLRVDVRLVAATHRDLGQMMRRNDFRSDLYYRLNVFPISLPALRERREDIVLLVWHFVEMFSRRIGKTIHSISPETMAAFESYDWPGNIRELQNVVERAIILSDDGCLPNLLTPVAAEPPIVSSAQPTRREFERDLILRTLQGADWVIGGACGAATRLGIKRTTLMAKMKKLGITQPGRRSNRAAEPNVNHARACGPINTAGSPGAWLPQE